MVVGAAAASERPYVMTLAQPTAMAKTTVPTLDELYAAWCGKPPEPGYRELCVTAWDAALAAGAAAAAEAKVKEGQYHAAAAARDAEKILTAMRPTTAEAPSSPEPTSPAS
jgi:hypothetical protein